MGQMPPPRTDYVYRSFLDHAIDLILDLITLQFQDQICLLSFHVSIKCSLLCFPLCISSAKNDISCSLLLPDLRKEFEVPPYSQSVELGSQIELRCHPPQGKPKPRVSHFDLLPRPSVICPFLSIVPFLPIECLM